jgi:preprotein translocase SecE subunit
VAWRIYKEGQGKWLRGLMAGLMFIGAFAAARALWNFLGGLFGSGVTGSMKITIPVINWPLDWRYLVAAVPLLLILWWAIRLYNKPKVVDFLIETENELKNRVTWPTRKEEVNASVVVVITVVIMMFYIFGIDQVFTLLKKTVYGGHG